MAPVNGKRCVHALEAEEESQCNGYHENAELIVSGDKSPYQDNKIISLLVGPGAIPFIVHSTILAKSTVLVTSGKNADQAKQRVPVPELDVPTAHTVVHYLYTDKYETLLSESQTKPSALSSYEASTCVYCAAVRYQLSGLADLAKQHITSLDQEVGISDVLRIAKDKAFPLLPDEETWYAAYLEGAIGDAMAKDPEPFKRPDFITQVEGNSKLLQIVWKTAMGGCASAATVSSEKRDVETSLVAGEDEKDEEAVPTTQRELQKHTNHHQADVVAPPTTISNGIVDPTTATIENGLTLDDIEPTVEAPQAPEPFTDELGFEKSKMYRKMSKNDPDLSTASSTTTDIEIPTHKRSDSVVRAEESVASPVEKAEDVDKIVEVATIIPNGPGDGSGVVNMSKKDKKKKTKKLGKSQITS